MSDSSPSKMTIAVTGSSGLVGSALVQRLLSDGHEVLLLKRNASGGDFTLSTTTCDSGTLDAVVHLAGDPIASGRWNAAKKERIRRSRVEGTRRLCENLIGWNRVPRIFVSASAVGYYGNRGDEMLDEGSLPGEGFLPEVVEAWEAASQPLVERGVRVVLLRFGMILSVKGGALAKMLTPFRYGLGGRMGSGRQYWSWITLTDAVGAICHALAHDALNGPVNVVAPHAVTNAEFVAALGDVLCRPAFAAMPAWAARLLLGEMTDALLLAGARVVPQRLIDTGYVFQHHDLTSALRYLLQNEV